MQKFKIEIEEISQRVEEVEAKDLEEALEIVQEKYNKSEIVLEYEDFKGYEVREYRSHLIEDDLMQNAIFDIDYGKAILLEGNKKLALIKQLGTNDNPYIVATGMKINKYKTYFEWEKEEKFSTLSEANERFEELGGYGKIQNDLIYSELGEWTLGSYNIAKFNNIDEILSFLVDDEIDKKELIDILSEKAKREIVFSYAEVVIEEEGKFYYGQDLYFFEEEINEKTRKIDKILKELNIKDIKPYDVIELLEQHELDNIDKKLEVKIISEIKRAGYEKDIVDFINYIDEKLNKEEIDEEEENEM